MDKGYDDAVCDIKHSVLDKRIDTTEINGANIKTGTLSANQITAGTMFADRISGGTLNLGGSVDGITNLKDSSNIIKGVFNKDGIQLLDSTLNVVNTLSTFNTSLALKATGFAAGYNPNPDYGETLNVDMENGFYYYKRDQVESNTNSIASLNKYGLLVSSNETNGCPYINIHKYAGVDDLGAVV